MIKQEHLAPHTTIKLGGPAAYYSVCENTKEIVTALRFAAANNLPIHILGGGSNTIFSDQGYSGLVLEVALAGLDINQKTSQVTAAAGLSWDNLVQETINHNLAGLECLSGIPGHVGAAPIQNIGAYGQDAASVITRVHTIDRRTLQPKNFNHKECEFGYRTSRFKEPDAGRFIITGVTFKLTPRGPATVNYPPLAETLASSGDQLTLPNVRRQVLALRRQKSMIIDSSDPNSRSCGSFFINPVLSDDEFNHLAKTAGLSTSQVPHFASGKQQKIPAAWLIAEAGFPKGFMQNDVGISTNHNLALINIDGTTDSLLRLARQIQQAVQNKFNLDLQIEPVIVN